MKLNEQLLEKYIDQYIAHFDYIHHQEEYKWRAVKIFQERWNLQEPDLHTMLFESVKGAMNLLRSTNFYPLDNLKRFAQADPDGLKSAFQELLYAETPTILRIENFRARCGGFLQTLENVKKRFNYIEYRSSMVILTLAYPERYFFYKYSMYKDFCSLLELQSPRKGNPNNLVNYEIGLTD